MSDSTKEKCENCKHWLSPVEVVERHYSIAHQHMEAPNRFGQCRRVLPGHDGNVSYEYPYSLPTQWCESWEAK